MATIVGSPRTGSVDPTTWSEISKSLAILAISKDWLVKTSFLNHMQIQLPTLLAKSTLSVTKLFQGNVFFLKTPKSSKLRTSGDSVSTPYFVYLICSWRPSPSAKKGLWRLYQIYQRHLRRREGGHAQSDCNYLKSNWRVQNPKLQPNSHTQNLLRKA